MGLVSNLQTEKIERDGMCWLCRGPWQEGYMTAVVVKDYPNDTKCYYFCAHCVQYILQSWTKDRVEAEQFCREHGG